MAGNIRQLLGHLEQKAVDMKGRCLRYDSLDEEISKTLVFDTDKESERDLISMREMQALYTFQTYMRLNGNCKQTSQVLGIAKNTVKSLVREHLSANN